MIVTAVNESDYAWPELASIVPCLTPGRRRFATGEFVHRGTLFHAASGLKRLFLRAPREIHYNAQLRSEVEAIEANAPLLWSKRWPKSEVDATRGLLLRESRDGGWVTGIAWERFFSVQGHNPWNCMHLSIQLGPLARGERRVVRGKLYLLRGGAAELLEQYYRDFGSS